MQRVDADYGIGSSVDVAGNDRDDTALRADVKLSRLRPEDVARDIRWVGNDHGQAAGRTRSPHASVFGAEGTRAGARRNLARLGFPEQLERNVSAVTASGDEQRALLWVPRPLMKTEVTVNPRPAQSGAERVATGDGNAGRRPVQAWAGEKCTPYRRPGPGRLPSALRLSEWIGRTEFG